MDFKSRDGERDVQFRKRIRSQMHIGAVIIVIIVLAASIAGLQTVAKFRKLTKNIRDRAHELPLSARLSNEIGRLRIAFSNIDQSRSFTSQMRSVMEGNDGIDAAFWPTHFQISLNDVRQALLDYEYQLNSDTEHESRLTDNSLELESVENIRNDLDWISGKLVGVDFSDAIFRELLKDKLNEIQDEAGLLPQHMKQRMEGFAESARSDYHKWFRNGALLAFFGVIAVFWLMRRFHKKIFQPLDKLVCESRRVAAGDFDHRIEIESDDEIAELASAMNLMTAKFQGINVDLNNQVRQRTQEVVRSEQMASVGFLAAGVAHEINNPLASIAWSAESLESRIYDILASDSTDSEQRAAEIEDMKKYLKRIQDEAFRCKGITSNLLSFSRLGDARKVPTSMSPLIEEVIDIVRPLSRYRGKEINFRSVHGIHAVINAQEIKQVVLNLVTNALDSVDPGGKVEIQLHQDDREAHIVVQDNGCGMESDVLKNIFEPFFTRRRDGQGTGLGLSITYRIIQEHGGSIRPKSDGLNTGSTFTVSLPVVSHDKEQRTAA